MFTNCADPTEKWTSGQIVVLGPITDVLCLCSPLPNSSNTSTQANLLHKSWVWAKLSARSLSLPRMLLSLFTATFLWNSGTGLSRSSQLPVAGGMAFWQLGWSRLVGRVTTGVLGLRSSSSAKFSSCRTIRTKDCATRTEEDHPSLN